MIPLRLTSENSHDVLIRFTASSGVYEIETTGNDPYLFTNPLPFSADALSNPVLSFEYFCATGTSGIQVFVTPPLSEAQSVTGAGLSRSEGFASYAIDLKPVLSKVAGRVRGLRLDFGSSKGKTILLRALQLRPPTLQEQRIAQRRASLRESEKLREKVVCDYLRRTFPCKITNVAVGSGHVTVQGTAANGSAWRKPGVLFLAEVPLHFPTAAQTTFPFTAPLKVDTRGRFALTLDRKRREGAVLHDRLLTRWVVVRKQGASFEAVSHAHYPDSVAAQWQTPEEKPRSKKGLGGLHYARPVSDLDELGISAVTVNIVVSSLMSMTPRAGWSPHSQGGRVWYTNDQQIAELDKTFLAAAQRQIVVSAIILLGQAGDAPPGDFRRLVAHPDADPAGIFAMPDVTSEAGLTAYAAVLDFLAQRYSRPDKKWGRIHHWIIHNEVNAGWVWTNAGDKTALLYLDLYQKSLRTAHLIARQYNPHARVFISLEHHWGVPPTPRIYAGRELMEWLVAYSRVEGDFEWAIAFHPYPQNLFDPRVWEDNEPTFAFDTPKITYKNLEVLDAWVGQPHTFFQGRTPRVVHLSEQGLNSRDYSEPSLRDQAAGMAYAWNKYKDLKSIEVFHYHNWVDNRSEGGLRIGLRRFPDDADEPLGKKPIWFVYLAMGTASEEMVNAPYLPVVGVRHWSEVRYAKPIPNVKT